MACQSSMQRSPPVHRPGSGACPDTRRSRSLHVARRARLLWDAESSKSSFSEIKTIAAGAAGSKKRSGELDVRLSSLKGLSERTSIRNRFRCAAESPSGINKQMWPRTAEAMARSAPRGAPGGSNLTALLTGSSRGAVVAVGCRESRRLRSVGAEGVC